MPEKKSGFVYYSKKFALLYGAGSVTASQALQHGLFVLPPGWTLYLTYGLSVISLACILLAGPSLLAIARNMSAVYREMQKLNQKEEEPPEP